MLYNLACKGWHSPSYYVFRDVDITPQDELDIDFMVSYIGDLERAAEMERMEQEAKRGNNKY